MVKRAIIEPNMRVVLDYTLRRAESGEIVDQSDGEGGEPIVYVHGYGMLVPGLEKALTGMAVEDEKDIHLSPEEGFGERDEELVLEIDRSEVPRPDRVSIGDELVAESPDGDEAVMRVIEVKEDSVVLDGNHPLAGEPLRYSVIIREVRPASEAEIADAAQTFDELDDEYAPTPKGSDLVSLGRKKMADKPN